MKALLLLTIIHSVHGWIQCTAVQSSARPTLSKLFLWNIIQKQFFNKDPSLSRPADGATKDGRRGQIVRLATKEYRPGSSKPSSRSYTTRKNEQAAVFLTKSGVQGDYNHYRSTTLQNTTDRGVSILTTDVMELVKRSKFEMENGDLGENILCSGVSHKFFVPRQKYRFVPERYDSSGDSRQYPVVEITEKCDPCANLCKLPTINDPATSPQRRVERCQALLNLLDQDSGLRGWYAKVINEGSIEKGYHVETVEF